MEFIHGLSIGDIQSLDKEKLNKNEISRLISEVFCKQIFIYGFVHADPH